MCCSPFLRRSSRLQRSPAARQRQTERLAALKGATVGEASEISEIIGHGGGYFDNSFSDMAVAESAGAFSIGALTPPMQLQITYMLE